MNNPIPYRVQELFALRDDCKKVYLLSNNFKEAVYYPHPVHFYCTATENFEEIGGCHDINFDNMTPEFDIPQRDFHNFKNNPFDSLDTAHPFVSYTYTAPHFKKEMLHIINNNPLTPSWLALEVLLPRVSGNAIIQKAMLKLSVDTSRTVGSDDVELELLYVPRTIQTVSETDLSTLEKIASLCPNFESNARLAECTFDLTAIIPQASAQVQPITLLIKLTSKTNTSLHICSSENYAHPPTFHFVYDTNFTTNPQIGVLTHAVGDFGTGAVHPTTGHLLLDLNDSVFDIYDKPIDIHHCYTSALAGYNYTYNSFLDLEIPAFNTMKLGWGWRLNIMESMIPIHFYHKDFEYNGFLHIDGNGEKTYFKPRLYAQEVSDPCVTLYEGISPYTLYYDAKKHMMFSDDEEKLFDDHGRMVHMKKRNGKRLKIKYFKGKITKVTEENSQNSVNLHYDKNSFLTQITAYPHIVIGFSYKDGTLHEISYPGGKKLTLKYGGYYRGPSLILLKDRQNAPISEILYSYVPSCSGARVTSITQKKHIAYPYLELPEKIF